MAKIPQSLSNRSGAEAPTGSVRRLPADLMRKEMRPISMRVTGPQYERLLRQRALDGLSIQEHARRAVDFYLAHLDHAAAHANPSAQINVPPGIVPALAAAQASTARGSRPKVARR